MEMKNSYKISVGNFERKVPRLDKVQELLMKQG